MRKSQISNYAVYVFKHVFQFLPDWVRILVWPVSRNEYTCFGSIAFRHLSSRLHFSHTPSLSPSFIFDFDFCVLYYMHMILVNGVKPLSTRWAMPSNKCSGLGAASYMIGVLFWFLNKDINNLCLIEIVRIRI